MVFRQIEPHFGVTFEPYVPQVDGRERPRRSFGAAEFPCNDARFAALEVDDGNFRAFETGETI